MYFSAMSYLCISHFIRLKDVWVAFAAGSLASEQLRISKNLHERFDWTVHVLPTALTHFRAPLQ